MTIDEATEILERARQGGAFARWDDYLWEKRARDDLRDHAREILGPDPPAGPVFIRLILSRRVGGPEGPMIGDCREHRDAKLDRIFVSTEPPLSGATSGEPAENAFFWTRGDGALFLAGRE